MLFFFFNDTATTEIYTLSLHDALPIYGGHGLVNTVTIPEGWSIAQITPAVARTLKVPADSVAAAVRDTALLARLDRKSTRLNSSHSQISYAVFCLKKKKNLQ